MLDNRAASTANWRRRFGDWLHHLSLLTLLVGCAAPMPDPLPPVPKAAGTLLICAGSNQEVFDDLKPRFVQLDVRWVGEAAECARAYAATSVAGTPCLEEQECHNPQFIDGKSVQSADSSYQQVVLFWSLQHGSLSTKSHQVKESTGAGPAVAPRTGGRGGGGGAGAGGGTSITKVVVTPSSETGFTGELFLFDPRPGQLRRGKKFTDLAPDKLLELVQALIGR